MPPLPPSLSLSRRRRLRLGARLAREYGGEQSFGFNVYGVDYDVGRTIAFAFLYRDSSQRALQSATTTFAINAIVGDVFNPLLLTSTTTARRLAATDPPEEYVLSIDFPLPGEEVDTCKHFFVLTVIPRNSEVLDEPCVSDGDTIHELLGGGTPTPCPDKFDTPEIANRRTHQVLKWQAPHFVNFADPVVVARRARVRSVAVEVDPIEHHRLDEPKLRHQTAVGLGDQRVARGRAVRAQEVERVYVCVCVTPACDPRAREKKATTKPTECDQTTGLQPISRGMASAPSPLADTQRILDTDGAVEGKTRQEERDEVAEEGGDESGASTDEEWSEEEASGACGVAWRHGASSNSSVAPCTASTPCARRTSTGT